MTDKPISQEVARNALECSKARMGRGHEAVCLPGSCLCGRYFAKRAMTLRRKETEPADPAEVAATHIAERYGWGVGRVGDMTPLICAAIDAHDAARAEEEREQREAVMEVHRLHGVDTVAWVRVCRAFGLEAP